MRLLKGVKLKKLTRAKVDKNGEQRELQLRDNRQTAAPELRRQRQEEHAFEDVIAKPYLIKEKTVVIFPA